MSYNRPPLLLGQRKRTSPATSSEYSMFAIPVPVLLALPELLPHQEMLRWGLLTKVTPELVRRVIFVSHEWTSGYDQGLQTTR